jgi:hypothetical protein
MDMGAYVIVINAEQVTVTGTKADDKLYFRHVNGRPGSWKSETFNQLQRVSDAQGGGLIDTHRAAVAQGQGGRKAARGEGAHTSLQCQAGCGQLLMC